MLQRAQQEAVSGPLDSQNKKQRAEANSLLWRGKEKNEVGCLCSDKVESKQAHLLPSNGANGQRSTWQHLV